MASLWRRLLDLLDHTTLPALLGEELAKQGVDVSELGKDDIGFAAAALRSLVTRLKTRTTWESHVGALLTHSQVLDLTGWSQAGAQPGGRRPSRASPRERR